MKIKLLFILLTFPLISLSEKFSIDKDKNINNLLDKKPIYTRYKQEKTYEKFIFRYDSVELIFMYQKHIPFECSDKWFFSGVDQNGNFILFDINNISDDNRISNKTYSRIIKMCEFLRQKNELQKWKTIRMTIYTLLFILIFTITLFLFAKYEYKSKKNKYFFALKVVIVILEFTSLIYLIFLFKNDLL